MKKILFSQIALLLALTFVACNNESATSENADTTVNSTTTTTTATGDYAALADEFDRNSEAGKYADPRTGKPLRIKVDRTTGQKVNAETNEPITRYVFIDNNEWWLYDAEGNRLGQAKLEGDKVLYDDNGKWVDYDTKWKVDGDEMKMKSGDTKVKVEGDESKIKTGDKKIKTDEDGTKVKDN